MWLIFTYFWISKFFLLLVINFIPLLLENILHMIILNVVSTGSHITYTNKSSLGAWISFEHVNRPWDPDDWQPWTWRDSERCPGRKGRGHDRQGRLCTLFCHQWAVGGSHSLWQPPARAMPCTLEVRKYLLDDSLQCGRRNWEPSGGKTDSFLEL